MRAAVIDSFGGPEVVRVVEIPDPRVGPDDVLVDVHGSSINPLDVAVRSGWMQQFMPQALPLTLGTDVAGVVAEVGSDVDDLAPGDLVYGAAAVMMGGSGAHADRAVTKRGLLARVPAGTDLVAAATLPLAGIAALEAVVEHLHVEPGCRFLVHGASGGVGLFAVALGRHLGADVVGTAHRHGVTALRRLGFDDVVDTDVTDLTSLTPFDLTLDLVGDDPGLPVAVTRPGGRVVGLRLMPDEAAAAAKGVTVELQGTQVTTERLQRFSRFVEDGVLVPHVADSFGLDDVTSAFARKEGGGVHGKVAVAMR